MTPAFTILIDGLCPLCKREARALSKLDRGRGRLHIVDITDPAFDPASIGRTMEDVMGSIHGIAADGRIVSGMEVFRIAYKAVGLGWLVAPTGWPILKPIFDAMYRVFAKFRPRLRGAACEDGRCRVP